MMVGRDGELHTLLRLATTPGTDVAILAGEPGIGKTRLIRELSRGVPDSTTVLIGQAEPGSLGRPFELLLSALDGRDGVDPSQVELLTDTNRTQVERLRAGLRLLRAATVGGPTVIVFEDLHWADSESIALFEHIADTDGDRLLIGTYRPDAVMRRNPIAGMLDRMERRFEVYHLRLARFDLPQTSQLLAAVTGEPPPYRAAVLLHHRTGGNPFFLEELLRDGHDLTDPHNQPLPWSLAEILRRQVDHLDPAHQRLVEAASMLGQRVPFDLLAAVTGRTESDLIAALRDLVAQGILVETNTDEFAFRHALVREAVGERLLGRERRRLHEAALDALLASGDADWALVARHAQGAGRFTDMLHAAKAGSAAYLRMGSAFQALQLAETGLDEAADDIELLATAAEAGWLAGLFDDAESYAKRWQCGTHNPAVVSAALRLRINIARDQRDYDRITRLHHELRDTLTAIDDDEQRAHTMAALAQSARMQDHDDEALTWVERTVTLTDALSGPAPVRLAALAEKGVILAAQAASAEQGRSLLAEVADEAEVVGEWLIAALAINKLIHLPSTGSWRELSQLLERMRGDAERAGSEALAVAAYYQGRARVYMRKGNLPRALDAIRRGRTHDLGYQWSRTKSDMHGMFLAGLLLEAGELAQAGEVCAQLDGVRGMEIGIAALRFHLACRNHDLDTARELIPEVITVVQSTGGRTGEFLHDLATAALVAPLTIGEVGKLIDGLDGPTVEPAYRALVTGQFTEATEAPGAALEHYLSAAKSGLPPAAQATAEIGAARCRLTLGEISAARDHAATAETLLDQWPGWRRDELSALRRQLARHDAVDEIGEQCGTAALTARERDVALLAATGLTNAEVARQLFISPRTAAVHISNILRKLGISSRQEIQQRLDQHTT